MRLRSVSTLGVAGALLYACTAFNDAESLLDARDGGASGGDASVEGIAGGGGFPGSGGTSAGGGAAGVGSGGAPSGGGGSGGTAGAGTIACAGTTCNASTQFCCYDPVQKSECRLLGQGCTGMRVRCDGKADCGMGQTCCGKLNGAQTEFNDVSCDANSCDGSYQRIFCHSSLDCPAGKICKQSLVAPAYTTCES